MKISRSRVFSILVVFVLFLSSFSFKAINNAKAVSFSDVPSTHWAYEAIMEMVNRGIMGGYPDGKFRPDNPIQRAETAVILVKLFNLQPVKSVKSSFADVLKSHWAFSFIEVINRTKLMNESITNGQFAPDKNLTRIAFVPIQVRALGMKFFAENVSEQEKSETLQQFMDQSQVPSWARGFLTISAKAKCMSGYPDKTFKPRKEITRAEMAVLIYEMVRPIREGESDGFSIVSIISVSGAPFRATLSKKLYGSLFDFKGQSFPNGSIEVTLNDIPFKAITIEPTGIYDVKIPIGFISVGEINLEAKYYEAGSKKVNKTFKAYSAIPFDLFPNQYRIYGFSYNPGSRVMSFMSKSGSPVNLEVINRTTGNRQEKKIEPNKDYEIVSNLANGTNNVNLIIQQADLAWRLTYGLIFTVN